uniref:Uncharacterized protein n=1 Tax=Melopsittacus undulatus TaxID=13146 RepID=A0A8V5FZL9_MELUD
MPGLYILSSWEPLPLKSSKVKACANGYSLSITAHLTYTNPHEEFQHFLSPPSTSPGVYLSLHMAILTPALLSPLRVATAINVPPFHTPLTPKLSFLCPGHLVLDEDVERSTFIIVTGTLWALESLSITLSTAQELATLPDGALRFLLPPVLTPRVPADPESEPSPPPRGGVGCRCQVSRERSQTCNPFPYEFAFELLVKGPCLLAGLESPSHALRADADPWASSATTTCVTLAEPHRYDRDVEIILYPCEPHHPHLVMEDGTMTYPEYEALVRSRRDYMRIARKDSSGERQVAFVQKRFHKDIFPNPVLMLNFCPAAEGVPGNLQSITREVLFLIDCSSTMSSPDLDKVKEALLVALKSLPSGTLLNVASFSANVKPLFPSSRLCSNETLQRACEHLGRLQADAGSTNLLAALRWVLAQPLHHGYPRQLFLFTNTAAGNRGRILRLVRRQASTIRCFNFGMGPRVCRRLLKGMAKVSRGRAEFLSPAERLQPKLIKSLKKAIEPAVSDITIDWYVPDSMEALLSPTEFPALYPGDHLISYCVLYSIAHFRSRRPQVWPALPWHGEDGTFPVPPASPSHVLLFTDNLLSPTHLDWDMLVEPSYLFSASPVPEPGEPSLGDANLPLRCQVVIHALQAGKPVSWEVTASLESVMQPRPEGPGREDRPQRAGKAWDKPLHRLAARSVIRDNENAAQREAELEQGGCQCVCPSPSTAQHLPTSVCSVLGRFCPPVPPESCANQQSLQCAFSLHPPGAHGWCHTGSPACSPRGVGHRYSQGSWHAGDGTAMVQRAEVVLSLAAGPTRQSRATAAGSWHHRSSSAMPGSTSTQYTGQCLCPKDTPADPPVGAGGRSGSVPLPAPPQSSAPLLQVQLQQARGPFQLTESFSNVVQIPLDRLRRASPYASHRASLSPVSPGARSSLQAGPSCEEGEDGHGSESDTGPHSADLESASWATAVALAWLEHRCAGFFEEWELVAAKADAWLQAQRLPEGVDVACLKGAARHLFLLLRHWDENIELNMLCYNPNNV